MSTILKALIVEDNPLVQKAHKMTLQELGYQVDVASNGKHALQLLAKSLYKIALVDIDLPDMNGIDVIKSLRKYSDETKVVVVTAYLTDTIIKNCSDAGSNIVLDKPIKVGDLT